MKKIIMLLSFISMVCLTSIGVACTKAQPYGSAGNANNPATGYITAIATNNGPNLTVTYAGSVQTVISFYSTNVSITGSWSGTKITSLGISNSSDYFSWFSINGVDHAITFNGIHILGGGHSYAGTGGGLTGITGLGLGQESFALDGVNNGISTHYVQRTVSPIGCIFATDLDIGATGLTLMPKEKMRQEW